MIHIFIGTKAQYIKTAPLIRRLDQREISYRLIDSGQHAMLTRSLRRELGLREPDVCLRRGDDIASLPRAALWMLRVMLLAALRPKRMARRVFDDRGGVCVIHGDTPTTLLSVFLARRARIPLAHLEAGLRSFNYCNPFPEELIRVVAMKRADLLFAPSESALANLERMNLHGEKHGTGVNTNLEALKYSRSRQHDPPAGLADYALFVIHRVETLHSTNRMRVIIDLIHRLARQRQVLFVLHPPTALVLKKRDEYNRLEQGENITLRPLLPHAEFINLMDHADFVVTDGGSIQEESYYLGKPCLLMRKRTERDEGIGANVMISEFDSEKIDRFITQWKEFARDPSLDGAASLDCIVERIRAWEEKCR
jgi:UDP-N-acetylglucosamine 2-epimerase